VERLMALNRPRVSPALIPRIFVKATKRSWRSVRPNFVVVELFRSVGGRRLLTLYGEE
jgi:hypothetical protein